MRARALLGLALLFAAPVAAVERLWVDTDPACDGASRHDPDDCLALHVLATHPGVPLAGVSAVFGNADEPATRRIARQLAAGLMAEGHTLPHAHRGARAARAPARGQPPNAAASALCAALHEAPLDVVALGPLTNVAAALDACPSARANLRRIWFVGGRRAGHVFHPAEDRMASAALGHGPVFRDLNAELDLDAVARVLATDVPVTLVPYEAARRVELLPRDLDAYARRGPTARAIAAAAAPWLHWWQQAIGRSGFYPFDLVAVAALLVPQAFTCTVTHAAVMPDRAISRWLPPRGLLFDVPASTPAARPVDACLGLSRGGARAVLDLLDRVGPA